VWCWAWSEHLGLGHMTIFGGGSTELVGGGERGAAGAVVPPGLSLGAALHAELRTCPTDRRQPSHTSNPPLPVIPASTQLERIVTTPDATDGSRTRGRVTPVAHALKQLRRGEGHTFRERSAAGDTRLSGGDLVAASGAEACAGLAGRVARRAVHVWDGWAGVREGVARPSMEPVSGFEQIWTKFDI